MIVPAISVVMGVYNRPELLSETLESVRSQTEPDWELIVVNDGSTDPNVQAALEAFAASEPRARIFNKPNEGLTRALIDGCGMARGTYIARIDSGDVMLPERLQRQRARLDADEAIAFVSCWTEYCGPMWEHLYVRREYTDVAGEPMLPNHPNEVIRKAPTHHGSVMFRRDRYQAVKGYREAFYYGQDWDLWYRLAETGRFSVVQDLLYRARHFPESISASNRRRQDAIGQCALDALWARMKQTPERTPLHQASAIRPGWDGNIEQEKPGAGAHFIGALLQVVGDPRCRRYYRMALQQNPWRMNTWIRNLQSCLPKCLNAKIDGRKNMNNLLDRAHARLARSGFAVRCAVKVRNQAQRVISRSLTDGGDPAHNGERRVAKLLIPECRHVMDVGAHRGDWTAVALELATGEDVRVIAYEPGAIVLEHLKARFDGNTQVEVCAVAVGDQSGTVAFFEDEADPTQSSTIPARETVPRREVPMVTIDDECMRLKWAELDFLKIDAEGLDAYVLSGAARLVQCQAIRFIQFEYNRRWCDAGATLKHCVRRLESQGYHVWRIMHRGLCATALDRYDEYWGYSNYLAVRHKDTPLVNSLISKEKRDE